MLCFRKRGYVQSYKLRKTEESSGESVTCFDVENYRRSFNILLTN
ncbi:unnamed protein product [Acanthoscelides obtectus]|uniref:Uncharacterized protein n=1 Tax=Acanthoscelides obtectus TaxID=200917 RepID=A0A9P0M5X3_ACAOB|nr:unnamed protein product [Acanthoscelides obtectus]CAK1629486.1 hypothetical protein AOBTE_LOCUS5772 [Acanthoscelides obtectus]